MGANAQSYRLLTTMEPLHRALSNTYRERAAIENEIPRRTADDVAWQRINDRITAGLRRSEEADARALRHIEEQSNASIA